jgi:hypothetical protein
MEQIRIKYLGHVAYIGVKRKPYGLLMEKT